MDLLSRFNIHLSSPLTPYSQDFSNIPRLLAFNNANATPQNEKNHPQKSLYRPEDRIHKDWIPTNYDVAGHKHTVFDIKPKDTPIRAHMLFMTGCQSDPLYFPRKIQHLLKNGIHITAARQVSRDESTNHIGDTGRYIRWLITDPDSPTHKNQIGNTPLFLLDHSSTKTQRDNILLNNHDIAEGFRASFTHVFENAPFNDVATAFARFDFEDVSPLERKKREVLSALFDFRSQINPHAVVGEPWIDRRIKQILRSDENAAATYIEACAFKELGRINTQKIRTLQQENSKHPALHTPSTVFADPEDGAAAFVATEREVSLRPKATLIKTKGGHNPVAHDHSVIPQILDTINAYIETESPKNSLKTTEPLLH